MKALGAQNAQIAALFLNEAAVLGIIGSISGYFTGSALARFLGERVFDSVITPGPSLFPLALLLGIAVALLGSGIPVWQAVKIEPVTLMRGR